MMIGCPLGDAGAEAFARADLPALRDLYLDDCGVGEAGARALIDSRLPAELSLDMLSSETISHETFRLLRRRFARVACAWE
jgi:hypothetical protein